MEENRKTADLLIKGCQAQVWLDAELVNGKVHYFADSNSLITKGIIAIFLRIFNEESPEEILSADFSFIDQTGLREHLLSTRANALNLMATQMKQRALSFASPQS
jgi:cysteine desulfuration protein SufE